MDARNKIILGLIGFLILGFASAAVVTYFANTASVQVSVDQPVHFQVSGGTGWTDGPLVLDAVYGGDSITWNLKQEMRGKTAITGYLTTTIENTISDATCADFTSLSIADCDDLQCTTTQNEFDAMIWCTDVAGSALIKIPTTYLPVESRAYVFAATFDLGVVPANYTVNSTATIV